MSGEARKDEDPLLEIHTTRSDRNNFKQLYYNTSLNQIWARSVLVVAGVVAVVVVGSSKLVFFSLTTLHFPIFWLTCISRASPPRDIDFEAKGFMCSSRKNQTHFCLQRCMNIHGYGNVAIFFVPSFRAVFLCAIHELRWAQVFSRNVGRSSWIFEASEVDLEVRTQA